MNLNPLHQGWFVPRLVEIVTVVLETKDFKSQCFFIISQLSLLKNVTQGCLLLSLVEIDPVVSEKGISKYHQGFFGSFKKKMLFHFENGRTLYWKDIRCPWDEMEYVKSLKTNRQAIRKSHVRAFSSGKLICAVTLLRYEELRCAIVVQFLNCTNVTPCALGHSF